METNLKKKDCTFPFDLSSNKIPFDAKSVGKETKFGKDHKQKTIQMKSNFDRNYTFPIDFFRKI